MSTILFRGLSVAAMWFVLGASPAFAQNVTVQQPVVRQFRVNTVVSVPDRGSLLLGGVSSANAVGGSRGPSLPSSLQFRSTSRSTARAHVFIHDFEAMDRAVLAAAGSPSVTDRRAGTAGREASQLTGMAAHAQQSLWRRYELQGHQRRWWQGQ